MHFWQLGPQIRSAYSVMRISGDDLIAATRPELEVLEQGGGDVLYYTFSSDDVNATFVKGDPRETWGLLQERYDRLVAVGANRDLFISIHGTNSFATGIAVVADPSGAVGFDGACIDGYAAEFEQFRFDNPEYADGDPADLMTGLSTPGSPELASFDLWELGPPDVPVAWIDREPMDRVLNPEVTPEDVLDGLQSVELTYVFAEEWL